MECTVYARCRGHCSHRNFIHIAMEQHMFSSLMMRFKAVFQIVLCVLQSARPIKFFYRRQLPRCACKNYFFQWRRRKKQLSGHLWHAAVVSKGPPKRCCQQLMMTEEVKFPPSHQTLKKFALESLTYECSPWLRAKRFISFLFFSQQQPRRQSDKISFFLLFFCLFFSIFSYLSPNCSLPFFLLHSFLKILIILIIIITEDIG